MTPFDLELPGSATGSVVAAPDAGRVVRTDALTRRFGAQAVVDGLDLDVRPGRIYGFLGPNGAGKTTTIRMLLGLIRPTSGRVWLFGRPLGAETRQALLRRVGALVETPSLYGHLTGRENLEATRRLLGVPRSRIDHVLAVVRMTQDAGRLVHTYSLGMKQRMGLALALLGGPELLVLDEPTNGLDPAGIHEVRTLLRALPRQEGVTVFLSSHLLGEVEHVADDVGILHRGRLRFQGAVRDLNARCAARVVLRVGRPGAARELLASHGWAAEGRTGEDDAAEGDAAELAVAVDGPAAAARINRLLVDGGHDVHHLSLRRPSLEETFLALTSD